MDNPFEVYDLGAVGVIKDRPPESLPPNAWSRVRNVAMRNDHVTTIPGWAAQVLCDAAPDPRYLHMFSAPTRYHWLQAGILTGNGYVCDYDGTQYQDVTPAGGFSIIDGDQFSGGEFNGIPILHNGSRNDPHYWDHVGGAARFEPLPFNGSETWTQHGFAADIVRPLGNFLVALGIYRDAGYYPNLVAWSDYADTGAIPSNWDKELLSSLAGDSPIADKGGAIIDMLPLHDLGVIYRQGSVWTMAPSEGEFVFHLRRALQTIGALSPNCIAEIEGTRHVVLGDGDAYVHNTQSAESILDRRFRRTLFRTMDTEHFRNSFLFVNSGESELWICYPLAGNMYPNAAVVWNYRENTLTERELPSLTTFLSYGVEPPPTIIGGMLWDDQKDDPSKIWDNFNRIWTERNFNPTVTSVLAAAAGSVYHMDSGRTADGEPLQCIAERIGLRLSGHDQWSMLSRVYPLMEGTGPVNFYVGGQKTAKGPVSWQGPFAFTPGQDAFFSPAVNARFHGIRIESQADVSWKFYGWKGMYTPTGTV